MIPGDLASPAVVAAGLWHGW